MRVAKAVPTAKSKSLVSGSHVFRETQDGSLEFVGDFEALYQNEDEPWAQSGDGERMAAYYAWSRDRLVNLLVGFSPNSVLEIGCGLGYVTDQIGQAILSAEVEGLDISPTAVQKARDLFPQNKFLQGDICSADFSLTRSYDVVILSQILWYVIEAFPTTLANCDALLESGGRLVFSTAFLKTPQRYGAGIVNGFEGLTAYLTENLPDSLFIESTDYDDSQSFHCHDGLVVVRKR